MVEIKYGYQLNSICLLGIYAGVLTLAGIVNSYAETLLTSLCYISLAWHIAGTFIIVAWMLSAAPTYQPASFAFFHFENRTGENSLVYVCLIGSLFAASTFTGYDTAAHVAEETTVAHKATAYGMLGAVVNCLILGIFLILGLNFCIQDLDALTSHSKADAYTLLWQSVVGDNVTVFFLFICFVGFECSNCANLTSASRMVYAFARDGAIPSFFYKMDEQLGCPLRSIWFCVIAAFVLALPGLVNESVLSALFSLTATGLYASYMIPIFLRVTLGHLYFQPAEFHLGNYSHICGWISVAWCLLMVIVLCLPTTSPTTFSNMNYSPLALGGILVFAGVYWIVDARYWFKGAASAPLDSLMIQSADQEMGILLSEQPPQADINSRRQQNAEESKNVPELYHLLPLQGEKIYKPSSDSNGFQADNGSIVKNFDKYGTIN